MRKFLLSCVAILAVSSLATPASANLVLNGGFETGDLTDWTPGGNFTFMTVGGGTAAHSGSFGLDAGPVGSLGSLSQTIATVPTNTYTISFWLSNPDGGSGTEFRAIFDGVTLVDIVDSTKFDFTLFTVMGTASTGSTVLEFDFRHDPALWKFDDVSVVATAAVPEPGSLTLMGVGAVCAGFFGWRRARKATKAK